MNKFLKIIMMFAVMAGALYITKNLEIAHATFTIPDEYKPFNEPFDVDIKKEGATGGTIIILQIIAGGLIYFAAPVGVIAIVISAFIMVVGGAESEKVDQAKKGLTWSIVGLLCVIFSYSAVRIIISVIIGAAEAT
ncbi:hypothetical protein ACFL21_01815 [Patescibacteria group bacterium]